MLRVEWAPSFWPHAAVAELANDAVGTDHVAFIAPRNQPRVVRWARRYAPWDDWDRMGQMEIFICPICLICLICPI